MTTESNNIGWKLWIQWVLAYAFTFVLTQEYIFSYFLDKADYGDIWVFDLLVLLVGAFVSGLIIGLVQWLILYPYGVSSWWIIITAIGTLPFFKLQGFNFISSAVLQSLILRKRVFYAGLWIVANIPTPYIFHNILRYSTRYNYLFIGRTEQKFLAISMITGLLGGAITGSVLVWLLRHQKPTSTSQFE